MTDFEKALWKELMELRNREYRAKQFIDYMFANRDKMSEMEVSCLWAWYEHENLSLEETLKEMEGEE